MAQLAGESTARFPTAAATRPAVREWLASSAARLCATGAAIFVRQGDELKLFGALPEDAPPDPGLIDAARHAFRDQSVVRRAGDSPSVAGADVAVHAAFRARIFGRPAAVAFALRVPAEDTDDAIIAWIAPRVLKRAEDVATPLLALAAQAPSEGAPAVDSEQNRRGGSAGERVADAASPLLLEQSAVISTLAAVMDQRELRRSLHAFANRVAQSWSCLRVTIGLVRSQRIAIEAVSGTADFDARSALMVDITQALEETRAAASLIAVPAREGDDAPPQGHAVLAAVLKAPALVSLPLVDNGRVVGAVLLERDREFSAQERQQLARVALLLGPVIALKVLEAMGPAQWLKRFAQRYLAVLLGGEHLGWKLGAIAAAVFVLWSSLHTQVFRVDADASIEASVQRSVVAGIPTFLSEVDKKAGDVVREGDVLARLDVESLQLERINWVGELDKLATEYRVNLSQRDRSNIRVLEARSAQAKSRIDLLDAQIARATLRAPIDGVVVSADLSQVLGAPVERGQVLFEVASLDDYRLVLMVDEADIGWVQIGQRGNLRLRSLADQSFAFSVSAITPVSNVGGGANLFRVEGTLAAPTADLRPGMGGVAKIDVEEKPIGWIWTRAFVDWLRVLAWKYGW